jgi:hypothetical protein
VSDDKRILYLSDVIRIFMTLGHKLTRIQGLMMLDNPNRRGLLYDTFTPLYQSMHVTGTTTWNVPSFNGLPKLNHNHTATRKHNKIPGKQHSIMPGKSPIQPLTELTNQNM